MGNRKLDEKTKTKSGWENRNSSYFPIVSVNDGASTDAFAFIGDTNSSTESVKTYTGVMDVMKVDGVSSAVTTPIDNKNVSLGFQAPISETEVQSGGLIGLVPAFEYRKLDSYRFLSVTGF
jgi:hypothetical protein